MLVPLSSVVPSASYFVNFNLYIVGFFKTIFNTVSFPSLTNLTSEMYFFKFSSSVWSISWSVSLYFIV